MMPPSHARRPLWRGFTLIELVTVIVILGVLSAVAIPVYLDYRSDARKAACKGAVGALRAAIANYYSHSAVAGTAAFPTAAQLATVGTVLTDGVPDNPYDNGAVKNNIVQTSSAKGTVVGSSGGWAYNPANGQIWANTGTKLVGENTY